MTTPNMSEPGAVHMDTPPVKEEETAAVTAESLGVSQAQFEKYYKADKGYNWEAHAREVEYRDKQQATKTLEPEATPAAETPEADADAKELVEKAGLNWDNLGTEIADNGELSEASMKALKDLGIPENVIQAHVNGVIRDTEAHVADVHKEFGGDEAFATANQWIVGNLDEAQIQEFNVKLNDPSQYKAAVAELVKLSGVSASPKAQRLEAPNAQVAPAAKAVKPFADSHEMSAAFRDPRYKTDPEFRNEVAARVGASDVRYNARSHSGGM